MLDKPTELSSVPFYWTVLVGKTIRYTGGHARTRVYTAYACVYLCDCLIWLSAATLGGLYGHMTEVVADSETVPHEQVQEIRCKNSV